MWTIYVIVMANMLGSVEHTVLTYMIVRMYIHTQPALAI